jgi:DUF4097 and DUF4098 domain-containing protein YvlB
MRKSLLVAIVAVATATGATGMQAQERPRNSITANAAANARVRIENPTGPTSVIGWDRREVQVEAATGSIRDVHFTSDGRRVEVMAPVNAALTIRVPKGAVLDVRSGSGPISIRGVENTIDVESGSGPISITATPRRITAVGFSGGVHIRGGGTEFTRAESASGAVNVTNAAGVVDLSSISGAVVARGSIRDGKLFSVSGAVSFAGTVESSARLTLESSSGSVSLRVPADTPAEYELSAVNGRIRNAFGPGVERSGHVGESLRFTVGSGRARIKATTVSGSVVLTQP